MVRDKTADLLMALLFAVTKIVESGEQGKLRIANARRDACSPIATIDRSSARPRIEACLKQFKVHNKADDTATAGRIVLAIQEQVGERDLYGWHSCPLGNVTGDIDRLVAKTNLPAGIRLKVGGFVKALQETAREMAAALILAVVLICQVLVSPVASFLQSMAITVSTPDHNQAVRSSDHG
ncbi:efflux RND transporter permease subunit [Rhizobium lusitanum]|uniref:Uncharacterized protein n=1 Tax=Rhizobium lusitanum TaxID=293958 RepID=A0A7X0IXX9_9HYPH|nr:efflux RND transporter permease subunit [Rhizobium lusitanum]MBB6487786.1 hypothetical protein [Rhizobium lusitanum]